MRIIIGISGGIAAYKAAMLLRLFSKDGHEVVAMPTSAALEFVGKPTLEALSGNPVAVSVFEQVPEVNHVRQAERADAIIIAPATADIMARLASGRANDLLSATVLTTHAPVILAPAMHTQMWEHPATVANVQTLRDYGYHIIEPAHGRLTGLDSGVGRLPEPEDIFSEALEILKTSPRSNTATSSFSSRGQRAAALTRTARNNNALPAAAPASRTTTASSTLLAQKKIVITAGGTREALDPVRFLGNRSTGKQGVALAEVSRDMGAQVHLIAANLEVPTPEGVKVTAVESTREMQDAVRAAVEPSEGAADALIMAAAVSDFRPAEYAEFKIKKTANPDEDPVIRLLRNPDILREIVVQRDGMRSAGRADYSPRLVVGFAAETGTLEVTPLEFGRAKLMRKGCDFLAVNTVSTSRGFGTDENTVTLLSTHTGDEPVFSGTKYEVSEEILRVLSRYL